jgi:two-component system nitrogen regulation response regulator GlnG
VAEDHDRSEDSAGLGALTRLITNAIPPLIDQLATSSPGRVYRDALELLERPLLVHALELTGGNQLHAARLLGLNRNTLRKRCRQLCLTLPRRSGRTPGGRTATPIA